LVAIVATMGRTLSVIRTIAIYLIGWLAIAAVLATIIAPLNVPKLLELKRFGRETGARVVRLDCANHNTAFYTFDVAGHSYTGGDVMPVDCRSLHKGEKISIFYDQRGPQLSRASEPSGALSNELSSIFGVCLIFPPFIMLGLRRTLLVLRQGWGAKL
jgi:hypothetical protein